MNNQILRIAVVEDTPEDMENCLFLLNRYGEEKGLQLQIDTFNSGDAFSIHFKNQYDFIILDINLSLTNGITIAKEIREKDEEVIIMFATNLAKFATNGYEVDAIDFALKPLSYASFYLKMERVMKRLSKREKPYITISHKGGIHKVDLSSVLYIEVISHDIIFHLSGGENITTSGTLKRFEETLKSHCFLRCNSCYLVNASKIKKIKQLDVELINGEILTISHPKRKMFLESFKEYVMRGGQ